MANYRHPFEDCSDEEADLGFSIFDDSPLGGLARERNYSTSLRAPPAGREISNSIPVPDLGFSLFDDIPVEGSYSGRARAPPAISVPHYRDPIVDEDLLRAMGESLSFSTRRRKPASKEAVEALEKMRVGPTERETICVVCMDDFSSAVSSSEVIKMPCAHVFHGDCILTWLQDRSDCPLCRLPLPAAGCRLLSHPERNFNYS